MKQNRTAMKVIGITGGVGSGKSQVLDYLANHYQAAVCQADQMAKNLQKKGTKCYKRIVDCFGTGILDENGRLDRPKLASEVFSDPAKLAALNEIVHPAVKEKIKELIRKEERKATKLFILEAALLIEGGYETICDELWYVHADNEIRRRRLKASRGYGDQRIEDMFGAQLTSAEYLRHCDRAVDNSDSFEETKRQLDEFVRAIEVL